MGAVDRYQPCKTLLSGSGSCRLCRPLALRRSSLSPWVSLNVNVFSLPKNKIMSTDPSQFEEEELHTLLWCRGNPDKVMEHAHQVSRCLLLGWRTYMSYIRVTHVKREVLVDQKDDFSVTQVEGCHKLLKNIHFDRRWLPLKNDGGQKI